MLKKRLYSVFFFTNRFQKSFYYPRLDKCTFLSVNLFHGKAAIVNICVFVKKMSIGLIGVIVIGQLRPISDFYFVKFS